MTPSQPTRVILLVGHGAAAADCPRELVSRLKALEGRRQATRTPPSAEELELDHRVRTWPRTETNDRYRMGLLALADAMRPVVGNARLLVAYNEFCAPTIEEAAEAAILEGAVEIVVIPSMLTPGGVHSEVEIPETLERIRNQHPEVRITYAWPYDLGAIATMMAGQLQRF